MELFYVSDLYSGMTDDRNLHGTKPVKIQAPGLLVSYKGDVHSSLE